MQMVKISIAFHSDDEHCLGDKRDFHMKTKSNENLKQHFVRNCYAWKNSTFMVLFSTKTNITIIWKNRWTFGPEGSKKIYSFSELLFQIMSLMV
jgi:hypothetical protein